MYNSTQQAVEAVYNTWSIAEYSVFVSTSTKNYARSPTTCTEVYSLLLLIHLSASSSKLKHLPNTKGPD